MANPADDLALGWLPVAGGYDFDRGGAGVGAEDEIVSRRLDVADGAGAAVPHGIEVRLAFVVRGERRVVAVQEDEGAGREAGMHGRGVYRTGLKEDETAPGRTVDGGVGAKFIEKSLLELVEIFHLCA